MPELPEVETIKRGLEKVIVGKKIVKFESRDPKVVRFAPKDVEGFYVAGIERRAKMLVLRLEKVRPAGLDPSAKPQDDNKEGSRVAGAPSNNKYSSSEVEKTLLIHLKMTGQLIWEACAGSTEFYLKKSRSTKLTAGRVAGGHPSPDWVNKLPNAYTRAIFHFEDKSVLFFNDLRRFGWLKVYDLKIQISNPKSQNLGVLTDGKFNLDASVPELAKLGPEPLEEKFKSQISNLKITIQKSKKPIKLLLLDQAFISGIGNIYADESLFWAKIAPTRPANSLTDDEIERLFKSIVKSLELGIKYGGSSEDTYVDAFGNQGTMGEHSKVYRRTGQPCPNGCGGKVERIELGGRGTHFCKNCQK